MLRTATSNLPDEFRPRTSLVRVALHALVNRRLESQVAEPCRAEWGFAIEAHVRQVWRWAMVQILRGADCGQDLGMPRGCGGEARQEVEGKKNSGLAPGESGSDSDWKGGKGEREKKWTRAKSGQSLGSSWPSRGKRVNECFGRFAQSEVSLERAGFVSRDLRDPR